MMLSLDSQLQKMIEQRLASGKYATPEDVVRAAMLSLEQGETSGDFEPGEMDRLLKEGERSFAQGSGVPANEVFEHFRERARQQRAQSR